MDVAYEAVTQGILVRVEPEFLESESDPNENYFVWAYHVTIENNGGQTVQLIKRHWRITDAMGRIQEVRGAGVVGEQPVLKPGDRFVYSSGTPLSTPSGIMLGSYEMHDADGEPFDAEIPAFSLDSPYSGGVLH